MKYRSTAATLLLGVGFAVASCGVTYTSPSVSENAQGVDVRVLSLTSQSVLMANRSPYTPRALPSAFYQTSGGGELRGVGALPEQPYMPRETRGTQELRVPPAAQVGPYEIGVGDVVLLATKSAGTTVEQLSGLLAAQTQRQGYTVRDDGTISIPDVGQVRIGGMTLDQAEAEVFQLLVTNGIDPAFSLEVSEFNSKRVAVGGAVRSATVLPLSLNPLSLNEALTLAGGLAVQDEEFATIRIYRDGTLYQIPFETYQQRSDLQDLRLQEGDAVYADTTYDLDRALRFYEQQINVINLRRGARSQALGELQSEIGLRRSALDEQRSNFQARTSLDAEDRDYVYLSGEVSKQGRFPLPYGRHATLADALYGSGGFPTVTGSPSDIYVLRPSTNPAEFGAVTAWHLDARNAATMTLATRMQMRPDDVIFIKEQPITSWNRAASQFFPIVIGAATDAVGG
jgi:polysaccharide export outer membrane protein